MTDERMPWFPCFPSKLLGAFAGMQPDEGYIYWIVCLRIYEVGGPCPDTIEALARRSGMTRNRAQKALDLSLENGRLLRVDGGMMNPTAEEILNDSKKIRNRLKTNGKLGGKISAEIRKQNQSKPPSPASKKSKPSSTHLHLHRQLQLSSNEDNTASATKARPGGGCPEGYLEIFWKAFPPYRREGKKAVAKKLDTLLRSGEVSWQVLIDGVHRYAASEPGEFACAPLVWLNQGRWDMAPRAPKRPAQNGNGFAQLLRDRQQARVQEGFAYDDDSRGPIIDADPVADPGGFCH